jgi:hypothetical protein
MAWDRRNAEIARQDQSRRGWADNQVGDRAAKVQRMATGSAPAKTKAYAFGGHAPGSIDEEAARIAAAKQGEAWRSRRKPSKDNAPQWAAR